jgi:aspartyl-tRNA synthetase
VRALCAPSGKEKLSRAKLAALQEVAKKAGLPALGEIVLESDGARSPLVKHLGEEKIQEIRDALEAVTGDFIFLAAGSANVVATALGPVRTKLAELLDLIPKNVLAFCYIVDFPLFESEKTAGHFAPSHHMFTAPKEEDLAMLESAPEQVRSYQHDLVLNGFEIAGGSIRIHDRKIQEKIFDLIGFTAERKQFFAHMLEAFDYGVPPHGGIAPGIDRLLAILLDEPNIREVIAFPKTGDGRDLLMGAPAPVEPEQLKELHIRIVKR